ncbi:MAG: zinc ribbon domain-containing protein, partial [Clostridia bacterium]|nr:zinc ribbon domain-containing protein [Clostridia bacterium]
YDHTAEFDAKDISDNKVIAMLVYLLGTVGIIIALLAGSNSPYASFHARQALKFMVVEMLAAVCALVLCWTIIVPLAYLILSITLTVIKFICFFQICSGKAKEPAIIRGLNFLK